MWGGNENENICVVKDIFKSAFVTLALLCNVPEVISP